MAILPDDLNPLIRPSPYDELNQEHGLEIGPHDTEEEISKALKNISLQKLSAEQRNEKLGSIKKILKILKTPASRVRFNAFILDKIDPKSVEERLKNLPNLKTENVDLPKPDPSHIFREGESLEIAEGDFSPVKKIDALHMDIGEVRDALQRRNVERHILFEV